MARITEDVTYKTTFDFQADILFLKKQATRGSTMLSRRYVFVGETHNSPVDKQRTEEITDHCRKNENIIIVAERDILKDFPYLVATAGIIHEEDRESSSASPLRNERIVQQIIEETAKDAVQRPHAYPREVLILFGQEHERHIRAELCKQLPKDHKICWWSFPSLQHQLDALPTRTFPNQNGFQLLGFTKMLPDPDLRKLLFTKGKFKVEFDVEVMATFAAPSRHANLYAVYSRSNKPATATALQHMDGIGAGKCSFRVKGLEDVRLVEVTDANWYNTQTSSY